MSSGIDLATLGVEIDSTDVGDTTVRFQDLVRASQVLESAVVTLEGRAKAANAALIQVGRGAADTASGVGRAAAANREAASSQDLANAAVQRALGSYSSLISRAGEMGRAMSQLTSIRAASNTALDGEATRLGIVAGAHRAVADAASRSTAAQAAASAGGGGGRPPSGPSGPGHPPSPPTPPSGGGSGGGPPGTDARIDRIIEGILTKIGQVERRADPRDQTQYTAIRRVGADPENLSQEQQGLAEIAGLYYDIRDAAQAADAAERARAQQAGSQFQQRLNENFGIVKPAGDPAERSARTSAQAFSEAMDLQDKLEQQRRVQSGSQFGQQLGDQYNNFKPQADSARDAASAFMEMFAAQDKLDQQRRSQAGSQFGQQLGDQYNNFKSQAGSARDSASVFQEQFAAEERLEAQRRAQAGGQFGQQLSESFNDFESKAGSARDSARVFEDMFKEAEAEAAAYAKQLAALRAEVDPTTLALEKMARAKDFAAVALAKGDISPEGYDLAVSKADADYSGMTGASRAAEQYASRLEALQDKLEPLRVALRKFGDETTFAAEAFTKGHLNMEQYTGALNMAETNFRKLSGAVDENGKKVGLSGQQYFWLFSNVKDFFNQVVAGGSITTAVMQQGPMLGQILAMGEGGVAGSVKGIGSDIVGGARKAVGAVGSMFTGGGAPATPPVPPPTPNTDGLDMVAAGMTAYAARAAAAEAAMGAAAVETAAVTTATNGLGAILGVAGGAIVALTAAFTYAYYRFDASQKELTRSTYGVGRRTGIDTQGLNDIGNNLASSAAGISRYTGRSIVAELGKTGNLNEQTLPQAGRLVKDFAYTTGQDEVAAAKELGEALDGTAGGVDRLNAKTGFLNATTREMYNSMVASGDKTSAQKILLDALAGSLENADKRLGFFARTWNRLKTGVSNTIDSVGDQIDQMSGGGTERQQLTRAQNDQADAQTALDNYKNSSVFNILPSSMTSDIVKDLELDLEAAKKRTEEAAKAMTDFGDRTKIARDAAKTLKMDDAIRSVNPLNEAIKTTQERLNALKGYQMDLTLPVGQMRELELATASTNRQLKQMAEDARSGGAAFADMVRNAQEGLKTVGYTQVAASIQSNKKSVEDQIRDLDRAGQNPVLSDPAKYEAERQRIITENASKPDAVQRAAIERLEGELDNYKRQREAITTAKSTDTEAALERQRRESTTSNGMFGRSPSNVQDLIKNVQRGGTAPFVSADLAAANIWRESSFREDARPRDKNGKLLSSAYGYSQLLDGTAKSLGVNQYDPQQNVEGGMRYLSENIEKFGSDFKGIVAYYWGPKNLKDALAKPGGEENIPAKYRDHAMDILRASGASGASIPGTVASLRNRETEVSSKGADVAAEIKYAGNSQYELDKARYAQEGYTKSIAEFGHLSDAAKKSIDDAAAALAGMNQKLANSRFGKDMTFELEQMGRTSGDAAAYSRVKGAGIDLDTEYGKAALEQAKYNQAMMESKQIAGDVWGSISSGILSGASAAEIASNALMKLANKLMDMAGNELIASLFGGQSKSATEGGPLGFLGTVMGGGKGNTFTSGGGGGGFLSGLFSGAGSASANNPLPGAMGPSLPTSGGGGFLDLIKGIFGFEKGGIMTGRGPVPLRPYAKGGVATGPQMALFGEASQNEAYIPLPDGRTVPVTLDRAGESSSAAGGGSPVFSTTVHMNGSSGDPKMDAEHAAESARQFRESQRALMAEYTAEESRPGGSMYRAGSRRNN